MTHGAIAPAGLSGQGEERSLVDRARRGDRQATHALYRCHAPRVHRLIFRLCGDEELTRDLTQDAFVRAFQQLDRFRGDSTFGTWLHRIAVNVALNAIRREQRQARWHGGEVDESIAADEPERLDPDLSARLGEAIDALPPGQRVVFVMHALEGYTHLEISGILGIAEGTSKGRLFDARVRLRKQLARFVED
jgi:RNA polymerase sigma-70 factor, ECF subfamily